MEMYRLDLLSSLLPIRPAALEVEKSSAEAEFLSFRAIQEIPGARQQRVSFVIVSLIVIAVVIRLPLLLLGAASHGPRRCFSHDFLEFPFEFLLQRGALNDAGFQFDAYIESTAPRIVHVDGLFVIIVVGPSSFLFTFSV